MPDSDFARQLRSLERYKRDGNWDSYLALTASPQFQECLAAWTVRGGAPGATGPLDALEFALGQAVRLGRIGDAAALTLATARWSRRLSIRNALGPPGDSSALGIRGTPGSPGTGQRDGPRYGSGEADVRTGPDVLRALLRAWELYDDGNPGAARSLLAAIVRGRPSLIRTSDGARWAVPLLRQALVIERDAAAHLLGLVDDNVLGDLARELTAAGEYAHARTAGAAMRLFFETKADILADLALAQAEAALKQRAASGQQTQSGLPLAEPAESADLRAATETANLAADAAQHALREGPGATMALRVPPVAGKLAKVAAALTLASEHAQAAEQWAQAMAAGEQEPDQHQVLVDFAKAQIRAGLLDGATQIIEVLLGPAQQSIADWQESAALAQAEQAAAALVAALAERGDVTGAAAMLRMIPDFSPSHPSAVRSLARAIAATDVAAAERLAGQVSDPDERGCALATVAMAALAARQQPDAVRVASGIERPRWRAQALVDLVGAPGQAADIPFGQVRDAIAAVTDAKYGAVLLAQYAVTLEPGKCRRLLAQALRLAGEAPTDDRWWALANIGATAAEAGLAADAREAFTAAQRVLARDPREWDFELYQLCLTRLHVGDTAGARETATVRLGAPPGRGVAGRLWSGLGTAIAAPASRRSLRQHPSVRDTAVDPAIAAAEAADIPVAVAALAAIACTIGRATDLTAPGSVRTLPPEAAEPYSGDEHGAAGQIQWVLTEAERLATGLRGAGAIIADESLTQAYTALGHFTVAERKILSLLPPLDPRTEENVGRHSAGADEDYDDEDGEDDEDDEDDEASLVEMAKERGIALADALVVVGDSGRAASFMREVAGRLAPCAWGLGRGAVDMLAELAAAQVRTGDIEGARATAAFAATVAQGMTDGFRLPAPFGSPMEDWTGTVAAVVDAMTALIREAEVGPTDFAGAGQRAINYAYRPWQARARTIAARAGTRDDPAERAELAALLTLERERIWRLATATFVRGATIDLDDAARALAVLAAAQAAIGELADARQTIAHARELAADIEDRVEQARTLGEVVQGLSAIGDHAAAVSVAREIGHPAYEGEAMAAAIAAAVRAGADADPAVGLDLGGEARAIKDTGWQAVALAAIAVMSTGPLDLNEVNDLISKVPHGDPRTRVWREVIGLCVAAGRYDLAAHLAAGVTTDADMNLAVIAAELGVSAAEDSARTDAAAAGDQEPARAALLRLLPRCARYPRAAYAACTALAMAFPGDSAMIARTIARHGAVISAAFAEHSRG
jgi:hypothetical protein